MRGRTLLLILIATLSVDEKKKLLGGHVCSALFKLFPRQSSRCVTLRCCLDSFQYMNLILEKWRSLFQKLTLNTINRKVGLHLKKKMQKCHYCFKHPHEKWNWPFNIFLILCLASQDIWGQRRQICKKFGIGPNKNYFLTLNFLN